jgi:hypothetical protein
MNVEIRERDCRDPPKLDPLSSALDHLLSTAVGCGARRCCRPKSREEVGKLESLCDEILGLTMNWNNTQMDGRLPITLECARKIIMKYVSPTEKPQVSYSFYMWLFRGPMRLRSAARRTSSLVAGRPGLEWEAGSFMPFHSKPQRLRDTLRFST